MRPLFLDFPEAIADGSVDPTIQNEFMLGPYILVAQSPLPDEMDGFFVNLPAVGWYNYWTGVVVPGGMPHSNSDAPPGVNESRSLDTLPVFVRAGAIVPQQPLVESTDEKPQGPLTLRVYPPVAKGKDCSGSLYLDDGETFAFRQGQYLHEEFTCRMTEQGIIVMVNPPEGSYAPWWKLLQVEIYGAARPAAEATWSALDSSRGTAVSTAYDAERHRITALVPDSGKGLELQLTY